jgi:hypothetical protein
MAPDGPMMGTALEQTLAQFRQFLISDDELRAEELERSDAETLRSLVESVEPLFKEINSVLDQLTAMNHPLEDAVADLEDALNSLAQAAIEARFELDGRG